MGFTFISNLFPYLDITFCKYIARKKTIFMGDNIYQQKTWRII